MCGHVGIAGNLNYADEARMKKLLVFDYFRGPDSTGFASVTPLGNYKVAKIASHPLDLFDTKKFSDALQGHASTIFLGHNRAATRGKVNAVNAHPFVCGHIIGAHNGTLDKISHDELNKAIGEPTEVDSEAIFKSIELFGIEATVKMLSGAWALVWVDLNEGTLNWLRNKERSFWYAYEKDFDKVFWASEYRMIDLACQHSSNYAGHSMEFYARDDGAVFFPTEIDKWYRFSIPEMVNGWTEMPNPIVKTLKGKEPKPVESYSGAASSPFRGSPGGTTQTSTTSTSSLGSAGSAIVNELTFDAKAPLGGYLTQQEFKDLTPNGCHWCHTPVEFDQTGLTIWKEDGIVLCPSCSNDKPVTRIFVDQKALAN